MDRTTVCLPAPLPPRYDDPHLVNLSHPTGTDRWAMRRGMPVNVANVLALRFSLENTANAAGHFGKTHDLGYGEFWNRCARRDGDHLGHAGRK